MSSRSKITASILGILIIGVVAFFLFSPGQLTSDSGGAIEFGWIGPLTGDAASYGVAIKRGTDLAAQEVNNQNILDRPIRIIYEDDQAKPNLGISAFQKLTDVNDVPVVIQAAASSVMLAVMPRAEKKEVVYISPSTSSDKIRREKIENDYEYIFRTWPSDAYQADTLASFAYKNLDARRAAIVYINTDYGASFRRVFAERFKELGGNIVLTEGFAQGTTDFRSLLTKTRQNNPDVVFLPSHYEEAARLLRQAQELSVDLQFLSDAALYSPEFLESAGSAANGLLLAAPDWSADSDEPRMQEFVTKFREEYGANPDVYAAAGYDLVHVLARAVQVGGGTSSDEIRKGLMQMDPYQGVTGHLDFNEIGEVRWGFSVFKVSENSFIRYEDGNNMEE